MRLTVEQVIAAFTATAPSLAADYDLLSIDGTHLHTAHLAISRRGMPSLLVPLPRIGRALTKLTRGLAVSALTDVEFVGGGERRRSPAAVVECRDPGLVRTFAALVAAVVARLEDGPPPSWASVSSLLSEWESLLGRRQLLTGESELGLWGELWIIARSSLAPTVLEAWRGPDAERVDFLLEGLGVEVKVGRQCGVHLVSQSQIDAPLGELRVILMSMHVMIEPLRGRSLPELVAEITRQVDDTATFEEKLASLGYSHDDEGAYGKRYALLAPPLFYRREDVPRVRVADDGVSDLRYRVELGRDAAMGPEARATVIEVLGLAAPFARAYPCA
jgi:hypothetical protein